MFPVRDIKRVSILVLITAIVIGMSFAPSWAKTPSASGVPTKTVAVIHCDYPPVSFWNKSTNNPSGFFVDIMDVIGNRAGLQVAYVCESGWPEMISAIESGKADLGALMKSAEREKRLLFTAPIEMTYLSFFARSQSSHSDDLELEGHAVGVIKGSMSYEQLKSRPGISLRTEGSYQEGIFSLLDGEIDLFAGEEGMILKQARETNLDDRIKKVGKPFLERERGIAVRKEDPQLLTRLNAVLPGFIGSPEYQEIYLRWYGKPTHYWTVKRLLTVSGLLIFLSLFGMAAWRYRSMTRLNDALLKSITERKHAEESLRKSEEMVRSVIDSVDEGFIVVDRDYRILTANRSYCEQVGVSSNDVTGKSCYALSHRIDRPCYEAGEDCAVKHAFETGNPSIAYHKHTDADENLRYVETKAFPLKNESGIVTSVIESVTNITEKHLLEQERLKTQKLEAIGTLAGGIAHDFNNLLQGVFGYISLARLKCDDKEQGLAALTEAEKALHLSVKLTNQLLTFSKGGKPVKKAIDLRTTVDNATKFALSGSRSGCRITSNDVWLTNADEGQIAQVIQNIVLNADQSMPEGGQIDIVLRNVQAPGKDIPQGLSKGNYVEISIADRGVGIPEHYATKIFDPYFTTKEKVSGLGLATSYSIIRNHNGMIDMRSDLGVGTTFFIYLPVTGNELRETPAMPAARTAPGRKGRVLVMDDEQIIRNVAGELLRTLGHDVEFAVHGEEALAKYEHARHSGRPFDVVILDLTIRGGMGGAATMQQLARIDPAVKAIVSSGYSDDSITSNHREQGFMAFLKKPYNVNDLQGTLDPLLKP